MKLFLVGLSLVLVNLTQSLPVKESTTTKDPNEHKAEGDSPTQNLENIIEYERYLKEVVGLLESDKEFRAKLDSADEADIRSGKIAHELDLVDHNVRTKLDELKRNELERLRGLAREYYERTNEIDREHLKIAEHLDHENEHTFEIEDLKKLIVKTGEDLAEADRQRRDEFKQYELQKEFEINEKKRHLNEEDRKKFEQELKERTEKHNKHEKIHHPGSKDQLEEVWEKQDHMDAQDFDPKKFFMMHDVDGNGFWDEMEVKALFKTELDKVYQQGLPEDDMRERAEEMERMREHVYKEADQNRDRLISFEEFMDQTKKKEYNQDEGWDTVDQQPQYSHDEYLEFERRRQEEINRLIAEGRLPPHPNMPGGYYPPDHGAQYRMQHPNEIPQGYHPNGMPQQHQYQYQQVPDVPYQQHPNAPPQYQQHPNAPPPQYQQNPNGAPPQYQQQPNGAPPQYQQHPNAVPQQHAPPQNFQPHGDYQQPNSIPVHEAQNVQSQQQQMKQQYGEQQRNQAQQNQNMAQQNVQPQANSQQAPPVNQNIPQQVPNQQAPIKQAVPVQNQQPAPVQVQQNQQPAPVQTQQNQPPPQQVNQQPPPQQH